MTKDDRLELQIRGFTAKKTATALHERIAAAIGEHHVRLEVPIPTEPVPESTIEVISLIISVPSAILAAMEVSERLKLKKRLEPIWKDVMQTYGNMKSEVEVRSERGPPRPPEASDIDRLIDVDQPGIDE